MSQYVGIFSQIQTAEDQAIGVLPFRERRRMRIAMNRPGASRSRRIDYANAWITKQNGLIRANGGEEIALLEDDGTGRPFFDFIMQFFQNPEGLLEFLVAIATEFLPQLFDAILNFINGLGGIGGVVLSEEYQVFALPEVQKAWREHRKAA